MEIERFRQVLDILAREFPGLRLEVEDPPPQDLDASADLPLQPGLDFAVNINLQNCDELHLSASNFWVEWFPCGDQPVFDRFVEALLGLLSGRARLVETYVMWQPVSSRLQLPTGSGGWKTVATWSNLLALLPWRRRHVVIQNRPCA